MYGVRTISTHKHLYTYMGMLIQHACVQCVSHVSVVSGHMLGKPLATIMLQQKHRSPQCFLLNVGKPIRSLCRHAVQATATTCTICA